MSENKWYLGPSAVAEAEASLPLLPFSKVVVNVGEDEDGNQIAYEAGDDTGLTLEVENPWGTQQIANDMLARVRGYAHQPFAARSAFLDDAAELGDGITVGGVYGALVSQDLTFGTLGVSDISAPETGETENEFGNYVSRSVRSSNRKLAAVRASLKVGLDSITAEIEDFETGVNSSLNVMDGKIESKISSAEAQSLISQDLNSISLSVAGGANSATLTLTANGITAKAANIYFSSITADSIVANSSITSPNIYGGKFYDSTSRRIWQEMFYDAGSGTYTIGGTKVYLSDHSQSTPAFTTGAMSWNAGTMEVFHEAIGYQYEQLHTDGTLAGTEKVLIGSVNVLGKTTLSGKIVLDSDSCGASLPAAGNAGRIFFLKE